MNRQESAEMVQEYAHRVGKVATTNKGIVVENMAVAELAQRMLAAADKYEVDPNTQSFETAGAATMLFGLREELLDAFNYAAMTDKLLEREGRGLLDTTRWGLESMARELLYRLVWVGLTLERMGHTDRRDYITQLEEKSGGNHRGEVSS